MLLLLLLVGEGKFFLGICTSHLFSFPLRAESLLYISFQIIPSAVVGVTERVRRY